MHVSLKSSSLSEEETLNLQMNGTFRNNDLGHPLNNSVITEAEMGHTEKAKTSLFSVTIRRPSQLILRMGLKGHLDRSNGRGS